LSGATRSIGPNKVTVPESFYKAIISNSNNKIKGIGFVMSNTGSNAELKDFSVSIDSVESLTKIDFFPALPDATEKMVEKEHCISCWTWTATNKPDRNPARENPPTLTNTPSSNQVTSGANTTPTKLSTAGSPTQCTASTKAGSRCKRMTTNKSGRCYQHD